MLDFALLGQFTIGLFSLVNPLGGIPIYLSLTAQFKKSEKKRITTITATTCLITILCSLYFGQEILKFFSISIASFRLGGGILIGSMALKMLNAQGTPSTKMNQEEIESIRITRLSQIKEMGVVPLGIPLFAGPGSISTCIIFADKINSFYMYAATSLCALLVCLCLKILLTFSDPIQKKLGSVGLNVTTRIMGLILLAISIEMICLSLKQIFPVLSKVI